jgi:hypothetical protein
MKHAAYFLPVLLLLCVIGISAQEPAHDAGGCPAEQAAARGMQILEKLHTVMAPAWHKAYPNKDYAALGEAMDGFAAMIPEVKKIAHAFKTTEREKNFNAARTQFIELVQKGAAANKTGENDVMYAVMPDIHTGFEEMAYYLLPLQFPEFEALNTVVTLMVDTHLKNEDYDAIVTSLEALKIKNSELQEADLPEDLTSVKEKAATDIAAIGEACGKLEAACSGTSKDEIVECLNDLNGLCKKFEQDYI